MRNILTMESLLLSVSLFVCFVFCWSEISPVPGLFKATLDNKVIQSYSDTKPKVIEFSPSQILVYVCSSWNPNDTLQWTLKKGDTPLFYGEPFVNNITVSLRLYWFDDGATLNCNVIGSGPTLVSVPLSLNTSSQSSSSTYDPQEKIVGVGDTFKKTCTNESNDTRIFSISPSNNNLISTYQRHTFRVTEGDFDTTLFCVNRIVKDGFTERIIHDITVLKNETLPERNIVKEISKLEENRSDARNADPEQPIPTTYIVVVVVVIAVVLVLLTTFIFTYRKCRKRKQITQTSSGIEQQEPIYATPHQVVYAELQLREANRERDLVKTEDQNPYAEIIGVLTPNENQHR